MIALLGCVLGLGLVLALSPLLWPRVAAASDRRNVNADRPALAWRVAQTIRAQLLLAGLGAVPLAAFVCISCVVGLLAAAVVHALFAISVLSLIAGTVAVLVPFIAVSRRAKAVRYANTTVWPDVVDHLVSSVRSGLALPDSVSSLAHNGPAATREPFAQFEADYRATGNFGHCVDELKDRLSDPIGDRILETLRMAREVGGNDLTLVLRSLATYLRQETAIRQEVQARQGWVMNAARLGVAAPWLVLLMLASRPEAAQAYNTPAGMALVAGGLVVSVIAYRAMIALGRLPAQKRWFA